MLGYLESFDETDRVRVFRFLATFSRWECALKNSGFVRAGRFNQAEANWTAFATQYHQELASITSPRFQEARTFLLNDPARRQALVDQQIMWQPNPRRPNETCDADYLFRIVRDIRNNLFHGGKFAEGSVPELSRDQCLIDSATTILESASNLDERISVILNTRVGPERSEIAEEGACDE